MSIVLQALGRDSQIPDWCVNSMAVAACHNIVTEQIPEQ
jgi:hypothetical protein